MKRALIALALVVPGLAAAHDLRPGVLTLVDAGDGDYALRFVAPVDNRGDFAPLAIELPPGCARDADRVHCARGLAGRLALRGLVDPAMKVVVAVVRGTMRREWLLDTGSPSVVLDEPPPSRPALWLRAGLLGGAAQLGFVLGLLLVLGATLDRRMLATLAAFMLASLLATLGGLAVPVAPVAACVAASVLLVAREATRDEPTAIRRWPWLVAAGAGLLHGVGLAPVAPRGWALAWFDAGLLLGELAVVAAVVLARRLIGERRIVGVRVHRAACYGLGALAAYGLWVRVVELLRLGG